MKMKGWGNLNYDRIVLIYWTQHENDKKTYCLEVVPKGYLSCQKWYIKVRGQASGRSIISTFSYFNFQTLCTWIKHDRSFCPNIPYKLKSFVLFFEVLTCLIISRSNVLCVCLNLLVRTTCEVEKMSLLSMTNLGGGESSLRLLPLFFRFFFTRELKKFKNWDTEVCYFKCFFS